MNKKQKLAIVLAIIIVPFLILKFAVDNLTHYMKFIDVSKYNFVYIESENYYFGGVIDDPQIAYEINEVLHNMKNIQYIPENKANKMLYENPNPRLDCYCQIIMST